MSPQVVRRGVVILALLVAAASIANLIFATASARAAVPNPTNPCYVEGWFVNPDEANRAPERTHDGFVFEDADLIHHATNVPLRFLKPGWFTATPAPDQPSFFSVEVRDLTTDAYGTLRWDKTAALWSITIGPKSLPTHHPDTTPGTFTGADPVALLAGKVTKWGKFTSATRVASFGVGYTNSPPGTVKTTVTTVGFMGKAYYFSCPKPTASPTTTPSQTTSPTPTGTGSATPSHTGTPSTSASATPTATASTSASTSSSVSPIPVPADNAGGDDSLPTTGASLGGLILLGLGVVLAGGLLTWWFRKRNRRGINAPY